MRRVRNRMTEIRQVPRLIPKGNPGLQRMTKGGSVSDQVTEIRQILKQMPKEEPSLKQTMKKSLPQAVLKEHRRDIVPQRLRPPLVSIKKRRLYILFRKRSRKAGTGEPDFSVQ